MVEERKQKQKPMEFERLVERPARIGLRRDGEGRLHVGMEAAVIIDAAAFLQN